MATAEIAPPTGFVLDDVIPPPPDGFEADTDTPSPPIGFVLDGGRQVATDRPFMGARTNPFQPLTAPYSEYQQRVPSLNYGLEPHPADRLAAINAQVERMNAQELRAIDAAHPSVAIPTEVPGTELPRTPIQLPRFTADADASLPAKIGVGLYNVGAGLVGFPINPEGAAITAATVGSGSVGGLAWAGYAAKETPRLIQEAADALVSGTPQQKTEALASLGLNTLIGMGGLKSASKGAATVGEAVQTVLDRRSKRPVELEAQMGGQPIVRELTPRTAQALMEPTPELKPGDVLPEAPKAATETLPKASEPLPAPENAPAATGTSAAGVPEQPVKAAKGPKPAEPIDQKLQDKLDDARHDAEVDANEFLDRDSDYQREQTRISAFEEEIANMEAIAADRNNPDRKSAASRVNELEVELDQIRQHADSLKQQRIETEYQRLIEQRNLAPEALQTEPQIPVPTEPAISFPGLGSLREADATPMRLGQIRKSEPELWKAITQHFGTDKPAKIASLAKERFEQMRQRPDQPQGPKWTTATEEPPLGQALYGPFGIPSPTATFRAVVDLAKAAAPKVKEAYGFVKEVGDEAIRAGKMTDYRRSVLNWSAKLQRSFGEAAAAQKEINKKVPDKVRREGITNWIQAGGDMGLLATRAAASTDKKLKAGYEAAMNLTPEELAVATDVKNAYDALGKRGQAYGVLNSFRDNYVTQIWDLGKGPTAGSTRILKERFRYAKARAFDSFFDGEQAGYVPKTKDIAKLLPSYLHEMNSVIAARQLVEQMSTGKASDGRPLVAPRGVGIPVDGPAGKATLIVPKVPKDAKGATGYRGDYKLLENQPALSEWVWRSEDSAGNPIFEKADLALHPEAHARLKHVLGRSAIREWYSTRTSAVAQIPKLLVKALDVAQSETKKTMLGFFAPFHQVQEGTHAVGHRVNPFFSIPKIDLVGNAKQMDAARHGLMLLPDRVSEAQFMEGFQTSGLVSRIPGIGRLADWYSNYLFKEYIPGLKFKTYEAILERNMKVYEKELASGEMKPEDVKALSAEQSNAAYGHLNYSDMARNPTMQHIAQLVFLAPDFLEARGRFAGQAAKGAVGTKVGREQVLALATLALAQATTAWIAAKTTGGEWDARHPFEFRHGSRKYTMRSVPEDIDGLVSHAGRFLNSRLSPLLGKGTVQYLSGVDYAQRKVTPGQTTKELLSAPIPLTIRTIPAIQKLTGMDRPGQVAPLEQLAGAMGLRISRAYPREKLDELHDKFLEAHKDPRVRASHEQHLTETTPVSQYKAVYSALSDRNAEALQAAVKELRAKGWKLDEIRDRVRPTKEDGTQKPLYYEKRILERQFRSSLNHSQRKLYDEAINERREQWRFFQRNLTP